MTPEEQHQFEARVNSMVVKLGEAMIPDTERAKQERIDPDIFTSSMATAGLYFAAKCGLHLLVRRRQETAVGPAPSNVAGIEAENRICKRLMEALEQGLDAEAATLDPQRPEPFSWPGRPGTA